MTNPFQDQQPGEHHPEKRRPELPFWKGMAPPEHLDRIEPGSTYGPGPAYKGGGGTGCMGAFAIILGIPLMLLGFFFGMCTMAIGHPLPFALAFLCFLSGFILIAAGAGAFRDKGDGPP